MPAIPCSTTILALESAQFSNLSPIESVPFRGFFWLKGDDVRRFIALKVAILLECCVIGKFILLCITNGFIMPGSFVSCTQVLDSLCVLVHNNDVVLRIRFFLAAVGVFLLFRIA